MAAMIESNLVASLYPRDSI